MPAALPPFATLLREAAQTRRLSAMQLASAVCREMGVSKVPRARDSKTWGGTRPVAKRVAPTLGDVEGWLRGTGLPRSAQQFRALEEVLGLWRSVVQQYAACQASQGTFRKYGVEVGDFTLGVAVGSAFREMETACSPPEPFYVSKYLSISVAQENTSLAVVMLRAHVNNINLGRRDGSKKALMPMQVAATQKIFDEAARQGLGKSGVRQSWNLGKLPLFAAAERIIELLIQHEIATRGQACLVVGKIVDEMLKS